MSFSDTTLSRRMLAGEATRQMERKLSSPAIPRAQTTRPHPAAVEAISLAPDKQQ